MKKQLKCKYCNFETNSFRPKQSLATHTWRKHPELHIKLENQWIDTFTTGHIHIINGNLMFQAGTHLTCPIHNKK